MKFEHLIDNIEVVHNELFQQAIQQVYRYHYFLNNRIILPKTMHQRRETL